MGVHGGVPWAWHARDGGVEWVWQGMSRAGVWNGRAADLEREWQGAGVWNGWAGPGGHAEQWREGTCWQTSLSEVGHCAAAEGALRA